MDGKTSILYLQNYIRGKDYDPERIGDYFLKLVEEVGELSKAIQTGKLWHHPSSIQGTIDEELWDVMYYTIALANCYGIDLEEAIREKEKLNQKRYPSPVPFEQDR